MPSCCHVERVLTGVLWRFVVGMPVVLRAGTAKSARLWGNTISQNADSPIVPQLLSGPTSFTFMCGRPRPAGVYPPGGYLLPPFARRIRQLPARVFAAGGGGGIGVSGFRASGIRLALLCARRFWLSGAESSRSFPRRVPRPIRFRQPTNEPSPASRRRALPPGLCPPGGVYLLPPSPRVISPTSTRCVSSYGPFGFTERPLPYLLALVSVFQDMRWGSGAMPPEKPCIRSGLTLQYPA